MICAAFFCRRCSAARRRGFVNYSAPFVAPVFATLFALIAPVFAPFLTFFAAFFAALHSWGLGRAP
jgi:hypothetical protein